MRDCDHHFRSAHVSEARPVRSTLRPRSRRARRRTPHHRSPATAPQAAQTSATDNPFPPENSADCHCPAPESSNSNTKPGSVTDRAASAPDRAFSSAASPACRRPVVVNGALPPQCESERRCSMSLGQPSFQLGSCFFHVLVRSPFVLRSFSLRSPCNLPAISLQSPCDLPAISLRSPCDLPAISLRSSIDLPVIFDQSSGGIFVGGVAPAVAGKGSRRGTDGGKIAGSEQEDRREIAGGLPEDCQRIEWRSSGKTRSSPRLRQIHRRSGRSALTPLAGGTNWHKGE